MNRDRNEELTELDRELAQMAQDVPEMPDDFHARWTEQIRSEAAQGKASPRKEKESRRQWRYILSAAAVFVFLIGGTLLTRTTGKNNDLPGSEALSNAAHNNMIADNAAPLTMGVTSQQNAGAAANQPAAGAEKRAAEKAAEKTEEVTEAEEDAAYEADAYESDAAVYEDAVYEDAYAAAAYEPVEEAAESGVYGAAEEEAPLALMATAMPTLPAETPVPEPVTGETEEFAEAEEPVEEAETEPEEQKQDSEFVSFLKDLGIFTAKALAVAACGAALAFLGALAVRAYKNRKK